MPPASLLSFAAVRAQRSPPPRSLSARERNLLDERELVLGVVVEVQARACPINMLTGPRREIINDSLGGRAMRGPLAGAELQTIPSNRPQRSIALVTRLVADTGGSFGYVQVRAP